MKICGATSAERGALPSHIRAQQFGGTRRTSLRLFTGTFAQHTPKCVDWVIKQRKLSMRAKPGAATMKSKALVRSACIKVLWSVATCRL